MMKEALLTFTIFSIARQAHFLSARGTFTIASLFLKSINQSINQSIFIFTALFIQKNSAKCLTEIENKQNQEKKIQKNPTVPPPQICTET